jgi:hypothetical protein
MRMVWIGSAALAVAVGVLLWASCDREDPLEEVARRGLTAVGDGDFDALFALISDQEKSALNLSKESFSVFHKNYVMRGEAKLQPASDARTDLPPGMSDVVVVSQEFRASDWGMPISMSAQEIEGIPKITSVVWMLFIARINSEIGQSSPSGEAWIRLLIDIIERDKDELSRLGINGLYFLSSDGGQQFTWDEYVANRKRALADYQERMKGAN